MKKAFKWIAIVFVGLIIIAAIAGGDKDSSAGQETTTAPAASDGVSQEQQATEPKKDLIEVTAVELQKAYAANEVGANKKYKGKELIVTGSIHSIDASIGDKPVVRLKAGGGEFEINQPMANFKKSEDDKVAELAKGQKIKLQCMGETVIMGSPILGDCVIL